MSRRTSSGDSRTRNYACVVYPESAPENWKTIISESKVPVFISPLHDKDINPTGEPKKAHYHVMAMYDGVKTKEQAEEFFKSFGGVGCEQVSSVRAYARYLCHLDNPEKAQYSIEDVNCFGGSDYITIIGTMADRKKCLREMQIYIKTNDINCYADLADYALEFRTDWYDCLTNNGTYFIKEYIKSRTWKEHQMEEK
ncbi:Plasmid replication protein [Pseudobutyrivibrio sp. UC1225]|uniref:replication protein n=1 Tax=Pseudobutyrivibrio sp. UC1225 TaxID=1798185 RepID=UPI0008E915C3|nr:replication protein [Pseudobutyrivibrio sp. UC1225]SFO36061.1 Plasmid replication protein [Pseudobutyrivibrio sp. UC1225]